MKRIALALVSLLLPAVAFAGESAGIRGGTLGYGIELSNSSSGSFGIRLGADTYTRKWSGTQSSIDYDMKLKLQTASIVSDWYPFRNNFRMSLGLMYDGNKLTLTGKPTGGNYTINGVIYQASEVATLDAQVDFKKIAPYFGIGYGRPIGRGLSFIADLGVLYQGSPKSTINVTCGSAIQGTATCTQLQNNATAEQTKLDDSLRSYKYYPVIALGLAYTF